MRYIVHTLGATASAAALVLSGLAAGTAHADAAGDTGLYAPSALVLTVGRGEAAATATVERAVTLNCAPAPSGTHPSPRAACRELNTVDGEFAMLNGTSGRPCTRQWDPVTITAAGVWQGKRVDWSATYGNSCEMRESMNGSAVFAF
ncbi:protease inhibitor protein [Streptomyces sp. ICN441]|uniref:Probable subtilase-type protease inhibitor n=1 Tax=Streptomyces tirandamycinicus TaxID=2174846 RepID=A0A2S1STE5_9ACTN|nr:MULTISPECIES: subtilase-type protease inhibitor [Streptomyces]AWI29666.1 protease inhibitor protein [Streptomyces tirandamycinicus]TFE48084.1 protease inhibitor protein [Streptomyces sp. ICN441]